MGLIKKPSEIAPKSTISVLVYGEPGIGKTTIACSAPNPVLFDYDGGVQRINGAHQVPTLQPTSWEDTNAAIEEIEREMPEVQTIVIDTAGKMLTFMEDYIKVKNPKMKQFDGSLSIKGFGVRKQMFVDFINRLSMMGKNVIFVAHEKEEKRGDEWVKRPEIGGSSAADLIKELDLVGYMRAIGKQRTIAFNPTENYYAKNTCSLPEIEALPVTVDENGEAVGTNNYFSLVVDKYNAFQLAKQKKTADYAELMDVIEGMITECKDADTLNEVLGKIGNIEHIYNSKLIAGRMLNKKASELGFKFDKLTKHYVNA
jgi:hypothetical protein